MPAQKSGVTKEDLKNFKTEIVHQFRIFHQEMLTQIKHIREGVANLDQKIDRFREEIKEKLNNATQLTGLAVIPAGQKKETTY